MRAPPDELVRRYQVLRTEMRFAARFVEVHLGRAKRGETTAIEALRDAAKDIARLAEWSNERLAKARKAAAGRRRGIR